jgi:hypothetical protein
MSTGIIPKAHASSFFFSTGSPDGLIGTSSRPASVGSIETETGDDFILGPGTTSITSATFTGLLPVGATQLDVARVIVEIYTVFPSYSVVPPSGSVPTRVNSPSDNAFDQRDSSVGELTFTATILNPSFTVANTVVNGINKSPNQYTGGEGAATGEEVLFAVTLTTPFSLPSGHYFFVPQALLNPPFGGKFLWLSAPKPITGGTGPFTGDLQTWIRNANLAPDWLRIGTDITQQGPFNAAFSLTGTSTSPTSVPEFSFSGLMVGSLGIAVFALARRFYNSGRIRSWRLCRSRFR